MSDAPRGALVTGGTDGIGREIACGLAERGFHLVVVGRDAGKGMRVQDELMAKGAASARFLQADLSLTRQASALAKTVAEVLPSLHVLVHSAGIVSGRFQLTVEGVERNFVTNYLSRFALTQQLLPLLTQCGSPTGPARILLIGGAARNGKIDFDDVNLTRKFGAVRALLQICKANDLFAVELARRLVSVHANVTVACLKVGVVKTNIRKDFPAWMKRLVPLLIDPLLAQSVETMAASALRLVLDDEPSRAASILYSHILRFKPLPPWGELVDPQQGTRLWDLSEQLVARAASGA